MKTQDKFFHQFIDFLKEYEEKEVQIQKLQQEVNKLKEELIEILELTEMKNMNLNMNEEEEEEFLN